MVDEKPKKLTRWIKPLSLMLSLTLLLMPMGKITQAVPNGGYAHPDILIQPEEFKVLIDKQDSNFRINIRGKRCLLIVGILFLMSPCFRWMNVQR
jgi:hypothetical protein